VVVHAAASGSAAVRAAAAAAALAVIAGDHSGVVAYSLCSLAAGRLPGRGRARHRPPGRQAKGGRDGRLVSVAGGAGLAALTMKRILILFFPFVVVLATVI